MKSRWLNEPELDAIEGFDLSAIGKQLAGALPGAIQGATTGAIAGPWGALIGAAAGGALSLASKDKAKPGRPAAKAAQPAAAPPAQGAPAAPSAAGQLFQLLQNPALQQSIGALASGQGGSGAGGGMPTGAILNLLGSLANNAAYEAESVDGDMNDSYLRDAQGRLLADPSSPSERAAVVWDRLSAHRPATDNDESEAEPDDVEWLVDMGIGRQV